MSHRLTALLSPRSIAVFGGAWAQNVITQLLASGFEGEIWPVHPHKSEVCGLPAYQDIAALPAPPDASFIGVNRSITPDILHQLSAVGAGGAVCFASGFAETAAEEDTGTALQSALLEAAGDMPFLGPNCYGFINYLNRVSLWPDQHGGCPVESGVAIIMQSSNIAISLTMQQRGCPIAYMVTAGNQAAVSQAELALALLEDPKVTAIGLHIEGFADLPAWHQLAEAARKAGKPIIALKVGRSEQAKAATQSHTASLAGSDAGADAFLKRLGIARIDTISAFLETLKFLHYGGLLAGPRLASLSCSGGEASLIADAALGHALSFPPLSGAQSETLTQLLGDIVHLSNPLDYQTYIWGDMPVMTAVFETVLAGDIDLGCLIFDPPRSDRCEPESWMPALQAFLDAAQKTKSKAAVIATVPELMTEDWAEIISRGGVVPMGGLEEALTAFDAAHQIHSAWQGEMPAPAWPALIQDGKRHTIDEAAAKSKLREAGLPVPEGQFAANGSAAADLAEQIGFPVVLKGLGFAHKTEAGAVQLNLKTKDAVLNAAEAMQGADGFLVEQMITDVVAELLIGIVADPAHGLVLTIGAGGVLTEILQDTQSLILPVGEADIRTALSQLRLAPLLNGYRGKPAADIDQLTTDILRLATFAHAEVGHLAELEINPYLAREKGGSVVDCLMITYQMET